MQTHAPSLSWPASRWVWQAAAFLAAAMVAACGELPAGPEAGPPAAVILEQPGDAAVFQGQSTLFQVRASGSGLTYQWSRDGVPIPGATDSHHTAPPAALGDDGATYRVAVTADGSAPTGSRAARHSVYPPLDLRFKWADAPVTLEFVRLGNLIGGHTIGLLGVGGPLLTGEGICTPSPPVANCSWELVGHLLIPGFRTTYHTGLVGDFGPDWVTAIPPGALITSLDLEEGAGAFAASVLQTTQTGTFTSVLGSVSVDQLPATASAEGARGSVLTAVSFQGGLVTYVSYAWSEAQAVRYEAKVVATTVAGAGSAATDLAAQGYLITAFGAGNFGVNGVVLVGTRREGDSAPRAVQVLEVGANLSSPAGYAAIGYLYDRAARRWTMIFER